MGKEGLLSTLLCMLVAFELKTWVLCLPPPPPTVFYSPIEDKRSALSYQVHARFVESHTKLRMREVRSTGPGWGIGITSIPGVGVCGGLTGELGDAFGNGLREGCVGNWVDDTISTGIPSVSRARSVCVDT